MRTVDEPRVAPAESRSTASARRRRARRNARCAGPHRDRRIHAQHRAGDHDDEDGFHELPLENDDD